MGAEDKVRQLFVHMSMGDDLATIGSSRSLTARWHYRFMGQQLEAAWKARGAPLNKWNPAFITGDLEVADMFHRHDAHD